MVAPLPVDVSPKSHAYAVIVPSASLEAVPSKLTDCPTIGLEGVKVKLAVGGPSVMVLVADCDPDRLLLSFTVTVTVNVPVDV